MEKRVNENLTKAGFEISLDHCIILAHLWREDGTNQKSLCEFAGRNKTTITRSIDSLEAQNYVVRIPDKNDRRNKLIYLTHKGKAAREALSTVMLQTNDEATKGIPENEIQVCKSVLHRIFLNLADEEHIQHFIFDSNKRNHQK